MIVSKSEAKLPFESKLDEKDVVYNSADDGNLFKIFGLLLPDETENHYRRLPVDVAKSVSDGVLWLYRNTAGGRVRFRTDSPYVSIYAKESNVARMVHMPVTGSGGFDLYSVGPEAEGNVYSGTFVPDFNEKEEYESILYFMEQGAEHSVTIHFPLYANTDILYIGLKEGSFCEPVDDYRKIPPVVYYGSSITQGGCASTPGAAYQNIISRALNVDHINLGFSGSAKGEKEILDYINGLDMSVFVLDYDHNAPSPEYLNNTHKAFYEGIRSLHPDLPVVMITRPKAHLTEDEKERLSVVKRTYDEAVAGGDKNVYFIDGSTFFEPVYGDGALVDNCHPTSLGFMYMARKIGSVIEKLI